MNKFEDLIRKNQPLFDDAEPDTGHLERFAAKLEQFEAGTGKPLLLQFSFVWRAAAAIVILISVSLLFRHIDTLDLIKTGHSQALPGELIEASHYYTNLNNERIEKIGKLAGHEPEKAGIASLAQKEAETVSQTTMELRKQYIETRDDRLINAIITNYRVLGELLDHIIHRMNETE